MFLITQTWHNNQYASVHLVREFYQIKDERVITSFESYKTSGACSAAEAYEAACSIHT